MNRGSVCHGTQRTSEDASVELLALAIRLEFLMFVCLARYFIDRHTDLERQFNINVDDGKITLAKPLDRETDMWHNITVTATEVSK